MSSAPRKERPMSEEAQAVVELWENAFNNCPHYPGTRACECKVCLEGMVAAALDSRERLAERTKERDEAIVLARGWEESCHAVGRSAERKLEAARAEALTHATNCYEQGKLDGRAEATKAERERLHTLLESLQAIIDPEENREADSLITQELVDCKTCAAIRAPRQPEPKKHNCACDFHIDHAFCGSSLCACNPPALPYSQVPNAPPSEEPRPQLGRETCQDCGRVQWLVWGAEQGLWIKFSGGQAILCPECFDKRAARQGRLLTWTPTLHPAVPSSEPAREEPDPALLDAIRGSLKRGKP